MVKIITIVLALLTARAAAESPEEDDDPAFNMLGFRVAIGALPIEGHRAVAVSLGVGVEHPVFTRTRVFGEYEWLWLSHADERAMTSTIARPERHASGHRLTAGLRRELFAKGRRSVRLFVDGEVGGGLAMIDDSFRGVTLVPAGIVGLRVGYDIYSRSDESPSRTFEAELLVRAIAIEDGIGGMLGLGMLWGN